MNYQRCDYLSQQESLPHSNNRYKKDTSKILFKWASEWMIPGSTKRLVTWLRGTIRGTHSWKSRDYLHAIKPFVYFGFIW